MLDALFEFGLEMTRQLQANYPWLAGPMAFLSELGQEPLYLAFLPLLYWCINKSYGRRLAYVFVVAFSLNPLLKHAFRGPRPYWLEPALGQSIEPSYGVPSNHAQLTTVIYLLIAAWVRRRWFWLLTILFVLAMGLSRIYLGVHFPHDVVVGFLVGGLILTGYWLWQRYVGRAFSRRILGQRLLTAVAVPAVLALLYGLVLFLIGEPDRGVAWAAFIDEAERDNVDGIARGVGSLLGVGVGLVFESSRVRFRVDGPWRKRGLRYLVGLVVAVAIWAGLGAFFPDDPLWLGIPLRIFRYMLLLLWVIYYAPMAFVRLRLAEADPPRGIQMKIET